MIMEAFNEALLAKQVWRFLKVVGTSVAKLLTAMCYCECYLLEAKLGTRMSFAWHGMCSLRDVVIKCSH